MTLLRQLIQNRNWQFWTLNILGWGGYTSSGFIGVMTHNKPDSYLSLVLATSAVGFVFSSPLRYLYRSILLRSPVTLAVVVLSACYAVALCWSAVTNILYSRIVGNWAPVNLTDYADGVMYSFYILLCWSGLYFGTKYYQQMQSQKEQALRAKAAAHEAQLKMLRYQLNPHFLFNTLNAISTLVLDGANTTANTTLVRLSDFLRHTLDNDPKSEVTLRTELQAIDMYLDIEKVRFADRLQVNRAIDAAAMDACVPSLILQPLIENAVKYAVAPREEGGLIEICARIDGDWLYIDINDDGPGIETIAGTSDVLPEGRGVGLRNTQERLRELYGDAQAFRLDQSAAGGLSASIRLPCRHSS